MAAGFEIIDAQVHLNQPGPGWQAAAIDSVIATGIAALDAVGVDRVLIGAPGPKIRGEAQVEGEWWNAGGSR